MTSDRRPFTWWSLRAIWLGAGLVCLSLWVPPVWVQSSSSSTIPPAPPLYLPLIVVPEANPCPLTSVNQYATLPIEGNPRNPSPPPAFAPDLNLAVRSYVATAGGLGLIAINGPTDEDAPQLAHLFRPARVPVFRELHKVYDWDWACQAGGCQGLPIDFPDVTLVTMETAPQEPIYPPARGADILDGVYRALVLYAEQQRITLAYTRRDTPAAGYLVHVEKICVDPNLLALYRQLDQAGRRTLPGLRLDNPLGVARDDSVLVSVRDTGMFMDPRSAKDWWQDTVRARLAAAEATDAHNSLPLSGE